MTGGCGTYEEIKVNYIQVADSGADVNGDGTVDLADGITAFQVATHRNEAVNIRPDEVPDIDGDAQTGMVEAVYIIRWLSR